MLLHEIFSLFESLDFLLTEGFKDDMYRLYPEEKENPKFKAAIERYNSDIKIKEALKRAIKPQGNIAVSIKKQCPNGVEFVNLINSLLAKEKERQEYREIKKGTSNVNETDYWMIPCHTFEEAHEAAFKYAGNLPRLSKEEITEKYGINTPKPATYYHTDKTSAEFLEYMKNEDRFFMPPSWCVTARNYYFNNYKLVTEPSEMAKCYILISKKYPNVRFCITLKDDEATIKDDLIYQKPKIGEVRDPWQIGGYENEVLGIEMMKLAFGENEVKKILQKVLAMDVKKLSDIVNGESMFCNNTNIKEVAGPMAKLKNGKKMFQRSALSHFKSDMPELENGWDMFYACSELAHIPNIDLSSLITGINMFNECEQLSGFAVEKMPSLEVSDKMFYSTDIVEFYTSMPKLKKSCRNVWIL